MLLEHIRSQFNSLPFTRCFGIDKVEVVVSDRGEFDAEVMSSALVLVRNGGALCEFSKVRGILRQVQAHGDIRSPLVGTLVDIDAFHTGHVLGIIAFLSGNKHVVGFLAKVIGELRVRNLRCTAAVLVVIGVGPSRPEAARVGVTVAVFHVIDNVRRGTICNTGGESVITRIGTKVVAKTAIGIRRALVHPALHHVTGVGVLQTLVQSKGRKGCGLFGNSGGRPVRPGNTFLAHPVNPSLASRLVRRTVTISTDGTPFRSEHGDTRVHSRFSSGSIATILGVRRSVEMERTTVVLVADARTSTFVRLAGPSRATHEDEVVGMLTNHRNHGVSMGLDRAHVRSFRFVPNFENHVVGLTEFLGSPSKEFLGIASVTISTFSMPVKDNVDVVFNGGTNKLANHGLLVVLTTLCIGTAMAVELFVTNAEGETKHFDSHVLHHEAHCLGSIVHQGTICARAPEEAHTSDLDGLVFVSRARTGQFSAVCLKFAVGAHRTDPVGLYSESRQSGKHHCYQNFFHNILSF